MISCRFLNLKVTGAFRASAPDRIGPTAWIVIKSADRETPFNFSTPVDRGGLIDSYFFSCQAQASAQNWSVSSNSNTMADDKAPNTEKPVPAGGNSHPVTTTEAAQRRLLAALRTVDKLNGRLDK